MAQADHGLVYCTLHDLHRAKAGFAGAFEGWTFHHSYGKANSEWLEKSRNLKIKAVGWRWNITYSMLKPCVQSLQAWYLLTWIFHPIPSSTTWYTKTRNRSSPDIRLPPLLGCQVVAFRWPSFLASFAWAEFPNSSKFIEELRQNRIAPVPMGAGCPRVWWNKTFVAETLETLPKDTSQRWWSAHIWLQLRFDEYVWRYASVEQEFHGFL